jgi:hypothetical protein
LPDEEAINKIIKIKSYVRGMEMRDKIKLRGKNKTKNSQTKSTYNPDKNENYDNSTTPRIEENEMKLQTNYNEIIVNNNIYNPF